MPASYAIFSEWQIKYVHISADIELNELLGLAKAYIDDPNFDPSNRFLIDLTDLTSSKARFRDVTALYSYYRNRRDKFDGPIEVAIVAPSDFSFGLAHMFFALTNLDKVMRLRIFRRKSDAATWLSLPVSVVQSFKFTANVSSERQDRIARNVVVR